MKKGKCRDYLVGCYHDLTEAGETDFLILPGIDYVVNVTESGHSGENILRMLQVVFEIETEKAGKAQLQPMYC